jgi:hypothetical protein
MKWKRKLQHVKTDMLRPPFSEPDDLLQPQKRSTRKTSIGCPTDSNPCTLLKATDTSKRPTKK